MKKHHIFLIKKWLVPDTGLPCVPSNSPWPGPLPALHRPLFLPPWPGRGSGCQVTSDYNTITTTQGQHTSRHSVEGRGTAPNTPSSTNTGTLPCTPLLPHTSLAPSQAPWHPRRHASLLPFLPGVKIETGSHSPCLFGWRGPETPDQDPDTRSHHAAILKHRTICLPGMACSNSFAFYINIFQRSKRIVIGFSWFSSQDHGTETRSNFH